jgi:hypothetical protein
LLLKQERGRRQEGGARATASNEKLPFPSSTPRPGFDLHNVSGIFCGYVVDPPAFEVLQGLTSFSDTCINEQEFRLFNETEENRGTGTCPPFAYFAGLADTDINCISAADYDYFLNGQLGPDPRKPLEVVPVRKFETLANSSFAKFICAYSHFYHFL